MTVIPDKAPDDIDTFTVRMPHWMHELLRGAVFERDGRSMNDLVCQGAVLRLRMHPDKPWDEVMAKLGYDPETGKDTRA